MNFRAASDLEDQGLITRIEKGVLKDLIISGDTAFQIAFEKFEQGDKESITQFCRLLVLAKAP